MTHRVNAALASHGFDGVARHHPNQKESQQCHAQKGGNDQAQSGKNKAQHYCWRLKQASTRAAGSPPWRRLAGLAESCTMWVFKCMGIEVLFWSVWSGQWRWNLFILSIYLFIFGYATADVLPSNPYCSRRILMVMWAGKIAQESCPNMALMTHF
ncbi:hypothetical protein LP416_26380 [Polaromonas sp. P2-4]|nr:hypothetical protein LP416_26380 [Polaromonas sp. P2-4]